MLRYADVAAKYPVEMPRALRDAGYYTAAIGKLHYHPQRNLHGYHQALLDESGRIESVDFRSDYRSWFWSQAPNLDPDATGPRLERFRRPALRAARTPASHRVDRPDRRRVDRQLPAARAFLPEGVLRPPAQPLRPAGALLATLSGCRSAGRHRGSVGETLRAAQRTADRRVARRSGGRIRCAARARDTTAPSLSSTSRSAASSKRFRGATCWKRRSSFSFPTTAICSATIISGASRTPMPGSARVPMMVRWPEGMLSARRGSHWSRWWNCATCCPPSWMLPERLPRVRSMAAACCH